MILFLQLGRLCKHAYIFLGERDSPLRRAEPVLTLKCCFNVCLNAVKKLLYTIPKATRQEAEKPHGKRRPAMVLYGSQMPALAEHVRMQVYV